MSSSRDRTEGGSEQGNHSEESGQAAVEQAAPLMLSQYQQDFPPPPCPRRRTPALPHPDNIGINPAFRLEFSTVQRDAYPPWPIQDHRLSTSSSDQQNFTKD
ncbi:hypothetical protein D4764_14G0007180 [Takifugu flavidus]|uniref:Uncharacterized protein n=2 Tax=Takifugu flavidus TaxID=433684 RepID=A0A5C6P5Q4_9TELE|nr:hypothetical protein D4764_14G0007180 [Takifugu flavidus]